LPDAALSQSNGGGFSDINACLQQKRQALREDGIYAGLQQRVSQRNVVLEEVIPADDGEREIELTQSALDRKLGGKMRNILELST